MCECDAVELLETLTVCLWWFILLVFYFIAFFLLFSVFDCWIVGSFGSVFLSVFLSVCLFSLCASTLHCSALTIPTTGWC